MATKKKILTKEFVLLFIFSVVICSAMNMLNVLVPLYVTEDLGHTAAVSGFLSTVYTIASCVSRPVNGIIVERFGRRRIMFLGALLYGAACFACGLIPAIGLMFVCRALMGIGYSAASTANNTASTDVIPPEHMSEGVGYFGMSQSIASAIGPAIVAFIIAAVGNRGALNATGIICLGACVCALAVTYEKNAKKSEPAAEKQKTPFFERTAIVASLFQGVSLFFFSCAMCFMTLYIVSRGHSSSVCGTFYVISSVCIVGVRLLLSRFVSRFPHRVMLVPAFAMLAAMFLLLPKAETVAHFWALALLYGVGYGIYWMVFGSEAVRRAAPECRGAANATFYFAFDAAIGIGASVWGLLIDNIGYNSCFIICALGFGLIAIASAIVFGKKRM